MKSIEQVLQAPNRHWVGDGFPVHGMFGYDREAEARSPFLLLDYGAPTQFQPNAGRRRGVGTHPHRGFETVTIVYAGEVAHRDSTGAGGVIGPGDVQWMTAGGGILHEEFHSEAYSASGGPFEMVQLWVNLPARDKRTPAHYQGITSAQVPEVSLAGRSGSVRVIAGRFGDALGPAQTYTPMQVWDVQLKAGRQVELELPAGWTTLALVQHGRVRVNESSQVLGPAQLVRFSRSGRRLQLATDGADDARLLLLSGEPIDEPIVGYGPFVMNTQQEIAQAVDDFNSGKFGRMPAGA
jgi:quercetin 2,3-dioxygenase